MAALACGGGGGGSPSAPPPPATVTGQWNGTTTITGISPQNHCVAQVYIQRAGTPLDVRATLNQSGSTVSGTFVIGGAQTCDYSGTLNGQRFSATSTGCQTETATLTCASGLNYTISDRLPGTIDGTFDGALRTFNGTVRGEARATRGSEVFDFALVSSVTLTKQ